MRHITRAHAFSYRRMNRARSARGKTIYDVRKFLAAKSFATRKVEISIQRMVTEEKKSFSNNLFRAAKACVCLTLNCIFEFRFCLISTFLAG